VTGQPGLNSKDRTAGTGSSEQDSPEILASTGQAGQNSSYLTAASQDSAAGEGKIVRIAKTVQLEQGNWDWIAVSGQPGQVSRDSPA
jgi:hypothetical protein